jgi:hypothetical protein
LRLVSRRHGSGCAEQLACHALDGD